MKLLEDRIQKEGVYLGSGILKVDGFVNHQVDPMLMDEAGKKFAEIFNNHVVVSLLTFLFVLTLGLLWSPDVFQQKGTPYPDIDVAGPAQHDEKFLSSLSAVRSRRAVIFPPMP